MDFDSTPHCTQCYNPFNKIDRLPLIIPTCGHTFCSQCIQSILSTTNHYEPFLCPKDREPMTITSKDLSQFPKNFIVLKQVEMKQPSIIPTPTVHHQSINQHYEQSFIPITTSTTYHPAHHQYEQDIRSTSIISPTLHQSISPTLNLTLHNQYEPEKKQASITPTALYQSTHKFDDIRSTQSPTLHTTYTTLSHQYEQDKKYHQPSSITPTYQSTHQFEDIKSIRSPTIHHQYDQDNLNTSTIIHPVATDTLFEKSSFSTPRNQFSGPRTISSKNYSAKGGLSISRYESPALTTESSLCKEHGKKLEFVCLDHQCKICSNCALVGGHKGHDIKSEEEIFREIEAKADKLAEIFQNLERDQTVMPEEHFESMYAWKIKDKQKELEDRVTKKFEEYRALLKAREERVLDEIKSKFSLLDIRLKPLNQFPVDLKYKSQFWKDSVQSLFSVMSEKIERGEVVYELLETKSRLQPNLLKEGEDLSREFEKNKGSPIQDVEKELNQLTLAFNNNFPNLMDSLCTFQVPQVDTGNIRQKDAGESPKRATRGSPNKQANNGKEMKKSTTTSLIDDRFASPESKYTSNYSTTGSNNFAELAHFGYKDTNLSPSSKIPTIHVDLDAPNMHMRDNSRSRTQRTPRGTSKSPSNARSVSPSGGRSASAKKRKLKVPVKYEGVVEGIESNKIEAADLFDAGLGDSGVGILSEYLKTNTKLKSLKLVKNKITDEGALILIDALYKNNSIENLHLSQNLLTDKSIGAFLDLFKKKPNIRTIFFNRNSINLTNVKDKVKQIMELGISISM